MAMRPIPVQKRFWNRVNKTETCWIWTGATTKYRGHSYGQISVNGHTALAHRISWEIANGPIPDGMLVCHKCDNPRCVNPDHLFLGTQSDNMRDCLSKGRMNYPIPNHCSTANRIRGEKHRSAKLNEAKVIEIKQILQEPKTNYAAIARRYGVSAESIRDIDRGISWKHVHMPPAEQEG